MEVVPTVHVTEGEYSSQYWLSVPFLSPPVYDLPWFDSDSNVWVEQGFSAYPWDTSCSASSMGDGYGENLASNSLPEFNYPSPTASADVTRASEPSHHQSVQSTSGKETTRQQTPVAARGRLRRTQSPRESRSKLRHSPSQNSMPTSLTSSSSSSTASTASTSPASAVKVTIAPPVRRMPHSSVEKKYRHNMITMFRRLRDALPALRHANSPGDMFTDGSCPRLTKAKILASAIDYIQDMEGQVERMQGRYDVAVAENDRLKRDTRRRSCSPVPRCGVFSPLCDVAAS